MTKRVLNVGQCGMDHSAISQFLNEHFDAEVDCSHLPSDTLQLLRNNRYDLVLINRKLDADHSDGLDIIKTLKADAELRDVPVMLVSNYDDAQQSAVSEGAIYGFGKSEYASAEVIGQLKAILIG